mmetsp:Transcript_10630/g.40034  ORF Transcript_10630/g.40034 Transcript_10630/m.40034 type:complete len:233 (+) Transcript_10630:2455-3153(+)
MPGVVVGVKAQQIRAEEPLQQRLPHGQDAVHLGRRPGRVQEPRDPAPLVAGSQLPRQLHQMVIVHPDVVVPLVDVHHNLGELLIRLLVGRPKAWVELLLARAFVHGQRHIVEKRPEHVVAESVVELCCQLIGDEDGHTFVFLPQSFLDLVLLVLWNFAPEPSDPDELHLQLGALQSCDEAAATHAEAHVAVFVAMHRDRKPVCHHKDSIDVGCGVCNLCRHFHISLLCCADL